MKNIECNIYRIETALANITVYGNGHEVYVVILDNKCCKKLQTNIETYLSNSRTGSPDEDIPKSFGNYFNTASFLPELKPVFLWGTAFQREVWKKTWFIPKGHAASYSDIAESIGNPRAFRAVGRALNSNPIPILVPCHRILSLYGLGGYAGGIELKRELLKFEGLRNLAFFRIIT
ncbi:methylated-DNA--[protein]-cysteine S-methyltransferase [bacterium]|nr:methylated-DNA--[protein]-cysteine S-methyltransferase [bacterium]